MEFQKTKVIQSQQRKKQQRSQEEKIFQKNSKLRHNIISNDFVFNTTFHLIANSLII